MARTDFRLVNFNIKADLCLYFYCSPNISILCAIELAETVTCLNVHPFPPGS